jgi:hypothetical protein
VVCSTGSRAAGSNFPPRRIALEFSSRNARVAALQKRWDRLRAGLDLILDQRGADMADLPSGATGLLVRDYKGKEADRLVSESPAPRINRPGFMILFTLGPNRCCVFRPAMK